MSRPLRSVIVSLIAAGMIAAACSSSAEEPDAAGSTVGADDTSVESTSTVEPASSSTAPASTVLPTTAPPTTVDPAADWGARYVGGSNAPVSGTPIKIGFVNQNSFSPESPPAAAAAVAYLNTELGGATGRAIELVSCPVESDADATACGTSLAADPDVAIVLVGALQVGNQLLYDAIGTAKPILIGTGLTAADFLSTTALSFTVGGAGVVAGITGFVATGLPATPTKVAAVHLTSPAGTTAVALFIRPTLERFAIPTVYVPIDPASTAADVQAALTSAGAADADVVLAVVDVANCITLYDALAALDIDPTVVSVGVCNSTPVGAHLSELGLDDAVPDGWYFGSNGYSQYIANLEAGVDTYNTKIREYAAPEAEPIDTTGLASLTFASTLTIAKIMNTLGADATNPDALRGALGSFTGPMMFQVGALACGATTILGISFPAVCPSQMGIQRYQSGTWTPIADGNNNQPIDLNAL